MVKFIFTWLTIDLNKKVYYRNNIRELRTFTGKGDTKPKKAYLVKKDEMYKGTL